MEQIKLQKKADLLSKAIRKAMIDADITYDQIGMATARAWRYRISNPFRMNVEQYFYLCQRLRQNPSDLLARALTTRDITRR